MIIDSFDKVEAQHTFRTLFGRDKVNFVAIDGTEYSRQLFDRVVFFSDAYSCEGSIAFSDSEIRTAYKDRFMV